MSIPLNVTSRSAEFAPPASSVEPPAPWTIACLNCHATMSGPFCAQCGQRAVPPHPSVHEIAGEAFSEFTGWDGKFVETFKLLLTRPGAVTRQFIEGKRVRFISPVRLYLTMSFIYFLLASAAPTLVPVTRRVDAAGIQVGLTVGPNAAKKGSAPEVVGKALATAVAGGNLSTAQRDSALAKVGKAPVWLRPIARREIEDPQGLKRNLLDSLPRVLFMMLPVFALVLNAFYRPHRYPAHLYFSIHFNTLVFMLLAIGVLAKFTYSSVVAGLVGGICTLAIPIYGVIALRGMYGGSIAATIAKGLGIVTMCLCASTVALYGLVYYASLAR
ncbi:MAG TPA: DUF3667 domain-containing protein [Gemmatimonadaceae bacterium]|nr:DUF3667 domain-containing protein [Gemmatimonadaceae bacterium]